MNSPSVFAGTAGLMSGNERRAREHEGSAIHRGHGAPDQEDLALQVDSHQIMSDLQRPLIAAANVLHERVDLVRAHQLDGEMFFRSAFEHGTKRIDMADVGG